MPAQLVELLLQLHLEVGDRAAAETLLGHPAVRDFHREPVEADLLNPHVCDGGHDEQRWLAAFNCALRSPDITEVSLEPGRGEHDLKAFDRLTSPMTKAIDSDRCVTILMSSYRPGPPLLTAVRSVLNQTWTNWELLVIDDASGPEYASLFDQVARIDPRIRVVRKSLNGGTYRARNTGLRQATGEFCTVVDADDWIHPQALERHVVPLIERAGLIGTMSRAVRVNEDLLLNRPGSVARVASAASLMFRTQPVVSRIGFFDPTSKGADTEFRKRIELAFGKRILELPEVLSILRAGETLSSAEISRGWKHPARSSYRKLYESWHEQILQTGGDPYLDPDAGRKFPEPRRWRKPTSPVLAPPARITLCVAGDLTTAASVEPMLATIRDSLAEGKTVAIMHLDAPHMLSRRAMPLVGAIADLIRAGEVEWIQPDDDVAVDRLVVHDPAVLQYPPTIGPALRVAGLVIDPSRLSSAPNDPVGQYCRDDVSRRATELFGVVPLWQSREAEHAHAEPGTAADTSSGSAADDLVVRVARQQGTRVRRNSNVVTTSCPQYAVLHVPLRSLADAERYDELWVAYSRQAEDAVLRWLRRVDDSRPAPGRADTLVSALPEAVALMTISCESLVLLASRHRIEGAEGPQRLVDLMGIASIPSVAMAAWWAGQSRTIELRTP
ncbi:MAG: glycosyltransferase family 2 protein [Ornithinimicrobium sp.]